MKKLLFVFFAITVLFSACKKEDVSKCGYTCYNGGSCNETTGTCNCPSGYSGIDCSIRIPECEINHYGSVRVNSSHSDAYDIYINGSYKGTQYYGSTLYNNIPSGSVIIDEYQVDYTFYQNHYVQTGTVADCGTTNANY